MIGRAFAGRIARRALVTGSLIAAATISACGGSDPQPPPQREAIPEQRIARFAYNRGQYDQAVILYDRALATAYTRDDIEAIAEVGYEAALALLRDGRSKQAAEQARRVREELVRRGKTPAPELLLVEAVASYASGDAGSAARIGGGRASSSTRRRWRIPISATSRRWPGALPARSTARSSSRTTRCT